MGMVMIRVMTLALLCWTAGVICIPAKASMCENQIIFQEDRISLIMEQIETMAPVLWQSGISASVAVLCVAAAFWAASRQKKGKKQEKGKTVNFL